MAVVGARIELAASRLAGCADLEADQSGAGLVGARVVKVAEDGQGLVPGVAGGGVISGGVMTVSEAAEDVSLLAAVAEFLEETQGLLVAGDGVDGVAEMVMGVAEAVPCVGLTVVVAEFPMQVQGLLAVGQRLLVHSEQGAVQAAR